MAKTEETLIIEDVLYQNLFGSNPCLAREIRKKDFLFMTNKQQYVERKKYKKEQIYDAIAKRIREICDLTDSVTSAECLKNTLLRMGYEIICTNDISRYNDRYELIPKFDKTYQIKVPFVSREKENMLLARALCEIQTGIHNDMECKIIARRLLMPKQEFLDQIKKMKMFLDELILPILPDIFV